MSDQQCFSEIIFSVHSFKDPELFNCLTDLLVIVRSVFIIYSSLKKVRSRMFLKILIIPLFVKVQKYFIKHG